VRPEADAGPRCGSGVSSANRAIFHRKEFEVTSARMLSTALAASLLLVLAGPVVSQAQDKVLAKVNGRAITEADIKLVQVELGAELADVPPSQRKAMIVEYLIQHELYATAAESAKLDQGKDFEARVAYYKRRALRDAYYDAKIFQAVTDEEAKKFYDEQEKQAAANPQIKARHILVEKEEQAKDIRDKLAKGGDFEKLAADNSKDPGSAARGGDLGFLQRGQTVKAFDEMLGKLKPGEISEPVKTEFGWHIIKVEERRSLPPFDTLKDRIKGRLVQEKAQAATQELRDKGAVEILDAELKAVLTPTLAPGEIKPVGK
jgi:peptidyl-prolyl cis-trans isomerase C